VTLAVDIEAKRGAFALAARFEAPTPGIVALFGRSGAGKSSLVAALAGLLKPARGRIALGDDILFDSERRIDVPPEKRRVGLVFQESRLFPHFTVRDNLLYGWKRAARETRRDPARIVSLLALEPLLDARPHRLSGGEKQRVAIGRALLAGPRLLLLDEPLANLDQERKRELLRHIERLRDEVNLPIVYVSHAMDEVARLADTLVLLESGRVTAAGDIAAIAAAPALAERLGGFELGAVLRARVEAHDAARGLTHLSFAGGVVAVPQTDLPLGAPVRMRVLGRDVILARQPVAAISVHNQWRAVVRDVRPEGATRVVVSLAVGDSLLLARVTRDAAERLALNAGETVYALCKSVALEAD
jgi:molybdate transport system ATP-binding protein